MDEFITNKIIGEDEEAYLERLNNEDLTNLQRQLNATNQAIAEVDTQQATAKKELEDNLATLTNQKEKTLNALKNEKTSKLNALKEAEENEEDEEDEEKSIEEEPTNKKSFREIFGEKFAEIKQKITEKIQEISSNIQKVSDKFQVDSDKLNADFNLAEAATVEKKEKLLTQQEKDTQNIQELEKTINTLKNKVVPKKKDNLEAATDKSNADFNLDADTTDEKKASLGMPVEKYIQLKNKIKALKNHPSFNKQDMQEFENKVNAWEKNPSFKTMQDILDNQETLNIAKTLAKFPIVLPMDAFFKKTAPEFYEIVELWRKGAGGTYDYPIENLKLTSEDFLNHKSLKELPDGRKQIQISFANPFIAFDPNNKFGTIKLGLNPALALGTITLTLHPDGRVTGSDKFDFDMKDLPENIKNNLEPAFMTSLRNTSTYFGKEYVGEGAPVDIQFEGRIDKKGNLISTKKK